MNLKEFFEQNPSAALGFSGGVDSAYLLYAAKEYGADVQPYYIKTVFQPQFEYEDAAAFCEKMGIGLIIIEYDILSKRQISSNPQNRCYYCKKALFSILKKHADKDGYKLIIDGTNASDDASDRPGMRALSELSVRSPLRECGITKNQIRELSKKAGLFTWNKSAYACLATRVQSAKVITADLLKRVEYCENILRNMGFVDFRVRVYEGCARLQMREEQFVKAAKEREEIVKKIKPYFETILLDMAARKAE